MLCIEYIIYSRYKYLPSWFDSNQYKNGQRQGWDSVAEGWQKWWKTFEHDAQKVNERLVELAEIEEGNRVLDIATGIGACLQSKPGIPADKVVTFDWYDKKFILTYIRHN